MQKYSISTNHANNSAFLHSPSYKTSPHNYIPYQIDKYHAEDILIHEFAHAIHCIGIIKVDTAFNTRLQALYEKAKGSGILDNTYRITDKEEYFAEAVQDWLNVNAEMPHTDDKHNWCNTREELQEYDPDSTSFCFSFNVPLNVLFNPPFTGSLPATLPV